MAPTTKTTTTPKSPLTTIKKKPLLITNTPIKKKKASALLHSNKRVTRCLRNNRHIININIQALEDDEQNTYEVLRALGLYRLLHDQNSQETNTTQSNAKKSEPLPQNKQPENKKRKGTDTEKPKNAKKAKVECTDPLDLNRFKKNLIRINFNNNKNKIIAEAVKKELLDQGLKVTLSPSKKKLTFSPSKQLLAGKKLVKTSPAKKLKITTPNKKVSTSTKQKVATSTKKKVAATTTKKVVTSTKKSAVTSTKKKVTSTKKKLVTSTKKKLITSTKIKLATPTKSKLTSSAGKKLASSSAKNRSTAKSKLINNSPVKKLSASKPITNKKINQGEAKKKQVSKVLKLKIPPKSKLVSVDSKVFKRTVPSSKKTVKLQTKKVVAKAPGKKLVVKLPSNKTSKLQSKVNSKNAKVQKKNIKVQSKNVKVQNKNIKVQNKNIKLKSKNVKKQSKNLKLQERVKLQLKNAKLDKKNKSTQVRKVGATPKKKKVITTKGQKGQLMTKTTTQTVTQKKSTKISHKNKVNSMDKTTQNKKLIASKKTVKINLTPKKMSTPKLSVKTKNANQLKITKKLIVNKVAKKTDDNKTVNSKINNKAVSARKVSRSVGDKQSNTLKENKRTIISNKTTNTKSKAQTMSPKNVIATTGSDDKKLKQTDINSYFTKKLSDNTTCNESVVETQQSQTEQSQMEKSYEIDMPSNNTLTENIAGFEITENATELENLKNIKSSEGTVEDKVSQTSNGRTTKKLQVKKKQIVRTLIKIALKNKKTMVLNKKPSLARNSKKLAVKGSQKSDNNKSTNKFEEIMNSSKDANVKNSLENETPARRKTNISTESTPDVIIVENKEIIEIKDDTEMGAIKIDNDIIEIDNLDERKSESDKTKESESNSIIENVDSEYQNVKRTSNDEINKPTSISSGGKTRKRVATQQNLRTKKSKKNIREPTTNSSHNVVSNLVHNEANTNDIEEVNIAETNQHHTENRNNTETYLDKMDNIEFDKQITGTGLDKTKINLNVNTNSTVNKVSNSKNLNTLKIANQRKSNRLNKDQSIASDKSSLDGSAKENVLSNALESEGLPNEIDAQDMETHNSSKSTRNHLSRNCKENVEQTKHNLSSGLLQKKQYLTKPLCDNNATERVDTKTDALKTNQKESSSPIKSGSSSFSPLTIICDITLNHKRKVFVNENSTNEDTVICSKHDHLSSQNTDDSEMPCVELNSRSSSGNTSAQSPMLSPVKIEVLDNDNSNVSLTESCSINGSTKVKSKNTSNGNKSTNNKIHNQINKETSMINEKVKNTSGCGSNHTNGGSSNHSNGTGKETNRNHNNFKNGIQNYFNSSNGTETDSSDNENIKSVICTVEEPKKNDLRNEENNSPKFLASPVKKEDEITKKSKRNSVELKEIRSSNPKKSKLGSSSPQKNTLLNYISQIKLETPVNTTDVIVINVDNISKALTQENNLECISSIETRKEEKVFAPMSRPLTEREVGSPSTAPSVNYFRGPNNEPVIEINTCETPGIKVKPSRDNFRNNDLLPNESQNLETDNDQSIDSIEELPFDYKLENFEEDNQNDIKPVFCTTCKFFVSSKTYHLHRKMFHPQSQLKTCKLCGKQFKRKKELISHRENHHSGENPYRCFKCDESFGEYEMFIAHNRVHLGKKPFVCKVCKDEFDDREEYINHKEIHKLKKIQPPKKMHPCKECDAQFMKSADLDRHMRKHTGEKPYMCQICNSRFQQAHNLTKHLIIHTREKNFACEVCSRKFGRNDALTRHMLTHSLEKPYPCTLCEKKFVRNTQLTNHMIKAHQIGGDNENNVSSE